MELHQKKNIYSISFCAHSILADMPGNVCERRGWERYVHLVGTRTGVRMLCNVKVTFFVIIKPMNGSRVLRLRRSSSAVFVVGVLLICRLSLSLSVCNFIAIKCGIRSSFSNALHTSLATATGTQLFDVFLSLFLLLSSIFVFFFFWFHFCGCYCLRSHFGSGGGRFWLFRWNNKMLGTHTHTTTNHTLRQLNWSTEIPFFM